MRRNGLIPRSIGLGMETSDYSISPASPPAMLWRPLAPIIGKPKIRQAIDFEYGSHCLA